MTIRRPVMKKLSKQAQAILMAMGLLVGSSSVVNAASTGNVDTTWASNGVFSASVFNPDETDGVSVVALADGKTLHLAREKQKSTGIASGYGLFQLTSAGALDTSFSTDGWLKQDLAIGGVTYKAIYVNSLKVLSNGSILVVGAATRSDDANGVFAAKYLSTGSLDTSFDTDGFSVVFPDEFAPSTPDTTNMGYPAVAVSASGKIYAWFTVNINRIFRLNADGSKDTSFSSGRGFLEGLDTADFLGQTSVGAFTVDETGTLPTAIAVGVHLVRDGSANSSAVAYKVKFDTSGTPKEAVLDITYAGTSNYPASGTASTNGYVRVDLGVPNIDLKGATISSDGFAYVVGGTFSTSYAAAINMNDRKRHDAFGTSGVSDLTALGITGARTVRVNGSGATRTVLAVGFNSSYRPTVVKYVNDVLASSFGKAGVATLSTCALTDIGDIAETTATDGGIVLIGNVNSLGANPLPQTPQVIRLGAGVATNTCGSGGGGGGGDPTLPLLDSAVVTEEAGLKAKVTITGLLANAQMLVNVRVAGATYGPGTEFPITKVGEPGELTMTISEISLRVSNVTEPRIEPFVIGTKYEFYVGQLLGDEFSEPIIKEFTFTGNVAAATPAVTTTTTVAPAATAVVPGVTVTDTKVYTKSVPKKVAAGSAIAVMTTKQAKTRDIETLTPRICLPANDDLVFIKTGRCVAQVVNEKTGKVLRRLTTRVVADEVSELNIGNEIVTLAPIYFGGASSSVDARAKKRLQSIKDRISAAGTVLIVGHSGILMGNIPENQEMSRARAIATRNELRDMGAKGPFFITPAGALAPATTKMTQAAQAKNRRVVIVLIP